MLTKSVKVVVFFRDMRKSGLRLKLIPSLFDREEEVKNVLGPIVNELFITFVIENITIATITSKLKLETQNIKVFSAVGGSRQALSCSF